MPYERVLVDRVQDAQKQPAYLKLNPNGLIPVLADGDLVLYETAAIALHLCDTHPECSLAPALGTSERAHFYKWLMWLTNTLQSALIVYFYPERWVDAGNAAGAVEVKKHAEERIRGMLDQLEAALARHGGPWLLGEPYTALDAYVFTLCRWTRGFVLTPPARERRLLASLLQRMLERPAVQRMLHNEGLSAPFF
ncbi:MAG: glutathione S-transferase N-terminal domain-containing protein [Hydrogenophaga sp.]